MIENLIDRIVLDDNALFHDDHAVAELIHHIHIVGNEQVAQAVFVPHLIKQLQDLCLDGHIQGGNRFVRDHKPRPHDQGCCDGNTLSLSSGKL